MPAVQHRLAFAPARVRSVRRPFIPGKPLINPYRLPHEAKARLTASLAPFRNREAAYALAVFVARFWSIPDDKRRARLPVGHIPGTFHIDRVALAGHAELGLSEARIRGAIKTLEEVDFLDRAVRSGSVYRATGEGLRRKPVLFMFGSEYAPLFHAANRRAAAARGRPPASRRPITPTSAPRPSMAFPAARSSNSPERKSVADPKIHSGELMKGSGFLPSAFEDNPNLARALEDLKRAIGVAGSSGGEGSA